MYRIYYITEQQEFDYIELDYKYIIGGSLNECLADSFCYINEYTDENGKINVTELLEIDRCEENDIEEKRVRNEFIEFLDKNSDVDWRFGVFKYIISNQEGIDILSELDVYLAYKAMGNSPIHLLRKLVYFLFTKQKVENRFNHIFYQQVLNQNFWEGATAGLASK
jgi:hypothetical protein